MSWARAGAFLAAAAVMAALPGSAAAKGSGPCDLGRPVAEQVLIAPEAGTWYQ